MPLGAKWYNCGIRIRRELWAGTTCRRCGLTFEELYAQGLLGCPHCYTTFRLLIEDAIPDLHGVAVPDPWKLQPSVLHSQPTKV